MGWDDDIVLTETVVWSCTACAILVGDIANQIYELRSMRPRRARIVAAASPWRRSRYDYLSPSPWPGMIRPSSRGALLRAGDSVAIFRDAREKFLDAASFGQSSFYFQHHRMACVDEIRSGNFIETLQRIAELNSAVRILVKFKRSRYVAEIRSAIEKRIIGLFGFQTGQSEERAAGMFVVSECCNSRRRVHNGPNAIERRQRVKRGCSVHAIERIAAAQNQHRPHSKNSAQRRPSLCNPVDARPGQRLFRGQAPMNGWMGRELSANLAHYVVDTTAPRYRVNLPWQGCAF